MITTLKNPQLADKATFYSAPVLASISLSTILTGYSPNTFAATVGDNYAVTLRDPTTNNATLSGNIILGYQFFGADAGRQGLTLLHELLHFGLQADDIGIDKQFGIIGRPGDTASSAFSNWLSNDCTNKK